MSTLSDCCAPTCCTPSTPPVQIPGTPGANGAAGAAGSAGISAFTVTTNDFVVPADTVTPVTINVASSIWMVIGQRMIIGQGLGGALANPGPGSFHITVIPSSTSVTLLWDNFPGDVAAGSTISSGAVVSPSGRAPASPMTVALGGTGGATVSAAQTSLGLGQNAIISAQDALAQDFTNAFVQVGAIDVSIPAPTATKTDQYKISGSVSIEAAGLTFAANQTLLIRIRDITNAVNVAQITRHTDTPTTIHIPSFDWVLPDAQLAVTAALHLQLQIQNLTGAAPGAGTLRAIGGSLSAIPIRKND